MFSVFSTPSSLCHVYRALNFFKGLGERFLVFGHLSRDISRDISHPLNSNICYPAAPYVSPVPLGYEKLCESEKFCLIAILSRVPLLWLSHRFLCGLLLLSTLKKWRQISPFWSFFFFSTRTGKLSSNLFWEIKNWVGAQFFPMLLGKIFFQQMQTVFQLWNSIFLSCILFYFDILMVVG